MTPAAYHDLFAGLKPRLFEDGALFEEMLAVRGVDLTRSITPADLAGEPSLTLVASRRPELFRRYSVPDRLDVNDALTLNPLYRAEPAEGGTRLTLRFPTPEYEAEFGAVKRYLPSTISIADDLRGPLAAGDFGPDYADLRRRRVLLDAPHRYC